MNEGLGCYKKNRTLWNEKGKERSRDLQIQNNPRKRNILVLGEKKIKRDFVSSGERKQTFKKFETAEGNSPVNFKIFIAK